MQESAYLSGKINLVEGNNFSGRSAFLQELVKKNHELGGNVAYGIMVGEIPANYISGLAPTVRDEIYLHISGTNKVYKERLIQMLKNFSFEEHFNKNPFYLSGGEQAILTIVCALLLEPVELSIDTTIEQLNKEWRTPLLQELSSPDFTTTNISIADNRFQEYNFNAKRQRPILDSSSGQLNFGKIVCPSDISFVSSAKSITLQNLSFGYSKKQKLLQNLNYEFSSGHIYHLNGVNGSGKTTLSKILTGVLKPTSGNILIENNRYNAYRYPGKIVGYSFQNPDEQIFSNTISEEVIPKKFIKAKKNVGTAKKIISSFGLSIFADMHPSEMPFVIRKRISLAATLANERDWYILDEPTIGQDNENVDELRKIINLFVSNGKGIILISHSENFISSFKDVITVTLKDGELIY
jgi:energy-coupling factor transport system ATP-binding protein